MYEPTRDDAPAGRGPLVDRARDLARKLKWLAPLKTLASAPSSKFGLQIESALAEVAQGEVIRLQLRKRDTAVVLSTHHYEELLRLKALYEELISQFKVSEWPELRLVCSPQPTACPAPKQTPSPGEKATNSSAVR